jgi:biotin transport system substrate-specific component
MPQLDAQVLVGGALPQRATWGHRYLRDAALVFGGSILMAVCAHVSIPLWFTPVPITLQTFGVMLLALTLGGWRASAALTLYLLEGAASLPVFSPHGPGGLAQLLGPTGGYLMAYPFAALLGGLVAEKLSRSSRVIGAGIGALACEATTFACGAVWLAIVTHTGLSSVITAAILPFLPGEVLKAGGAVAAACGRWRKLA